MIFNDAGLAKSAVPREKAEGLEAGIEVAWTSNGKGEFFFFSTLSPSRWFQNMGMV